MQEAATATATATSAGTTSGTLLANWAGQPLDGVEGEVGCCDALQFGEDGLLAAGTSLLTGKVWSGRLLLFRSSALVASAATATGNCDVCWLSGGRLASAGDDGSVRVWAVAEDELGTPEAELLEHDDTASCLASNSDKLASGSWDTRLKVWDIPKQNSSITLEGHVNIVHSVHWCSAADSAVTLISASQDNTIKLWDLRHPDAVRTVRVQAPVFSVCGHPTKGYLIAAGDESGVVTLYDVRADTSHALQRFTGVHEDSVRRLCFSLQNHSLLATASDDTTIRVLDIDTNAAKYRFAGHSDFVRGVAWDKSGKVLVSGSWDKSIYSHAF